MTKRVKSLAKKLNGDQRSPALNNEIKFQGPINPLFVELVLENILSFLKESNKSISLGEYRLVCKFWDQQIIQMIRRETHIKLHRILTPYPEGFGWTEVRGLNKFHYKVPYQHIHHFENVEVVMGSRWLKRDKYLDEKFEKWFEVMGHQVKSLIYSCSLKTYQKKHCTTLERILKEWCPNLERLTIKAVTQGCLKGLIFTSVFEDTTKEIICKKLTELTLNMNLQKFTWQEDDNVPNILTNPANFNQFVYNHGLPGDNNRFPEISNPAGIKITVPKELYTNAELPDLSNIVPENFFPEHLDGGVLGQLMKNTKIKTFTVRGDVKSTNREQLMAFFHYRQNNWRTSLKQLEIDWYNHPFESCIKDLVLLGKVKFPVVSVKLTLALFVSETTSRDMSRFLSSFSETLEHLDINVHKFCRYNKMELPLLPKLKTFVINQINICKLSAANLVENAPNLEKCYLAENASFVRDSLDTFFKEDSAFKNEHLKDFRLTVNIDNYFSGEHASKLLKWFPKVKRLELIGMRDEDIGMTDFLEKLSNSVVTHLKMSWCRNRQSSLRATIADDTAFIQEIGKLQNLVSLQMSYEHETVPIHVVPIAFRDGFGKLSNLRYLKLKNFGINTHERREIMKSVEHILLSDVIKLAEPGEGKKLKGLVML